MSQTQIQQNYIPWIANPVSVPCLAKNKETFSIIHLFLDWPTLAIWNKLSNFFWASFLLLLFAPDHTVTYFPIPFQHKKYFLQFKGIFWKPNIQVFCCIYKPVSMALISLRGFSPVKSRQSRRTRERTLHIVLEVSIPFLLLVKLIHSCYQTHLTHSY